MLIRCPAPAWLRIRCGPRRLCSGARLRAHVSPTRQDVIARVLGARGPLMAHLLHLIELLRTVADFILGGCDLRLHGPRARSTHTHHRTPASPDPKGRASIFGWRPANHRGAGNPNPPPPNPSPPSCPALAAAFAVSTACLTPPLAPCAQVMRVDAGGALKSFYLELGGRSRTSSATPSCAAHGPPPRFWP
jgi:hypothetical protein